MKYSRNGKRNCLKVPTEAAEINFYMPESIGECKILKIDLTERTKNQEINIRLTQYFAKWLVKSLVFSELEQFVSKSACKFPQLRCPRSSAVHPCCCCCGGGGALVPGLDLDEAIGDV